MNEQSGSGQELETAIRLSLAAGEKILEGAGRIATLSTVEKDQSEIASEIDVAVDRFIQSEIESHFPKDAYLGEESFYLDGEKNFDAYKVLDRCWVVDPIDGTNNFLQGLPYYAVCIGLMEKGTPKLGVVYNPVSKKIYAAESGLGARVGILSKASEISWQVISPIKNEKKLKQSMFSTGFSLEKGIHSEKEWDNFQSLLPRLRSIRRLGSAALDLCYVAEGVFDGYWEQGLKPWDVAAASVICTESGVQMSDFSGQEFSLFQETFFAARNPLFSQTLGLLQG